MENVGRLGPRELRAIYDAQLAKLRAFELPLYGLEEGWSGIRWCETPGEARATVGQITLRTIECALVHGDPDREQSPYLGVASTTKRESTMPWRLVVQVEPTPFEERIQAITDEDYAPPGATRSTIEIPVDGRPSTFEVLSRAEHLVARHDVGPYEIVLQGRKFDLSTIRLVTVHDLEPYIEGFWARR